MRFLKPSLIVSLLLACTLLPLTWLRGPAPVPNNDPRIAITDLMPSLRAEDRGRIARELGPFALAGAWQLASDNALFGNYSALGQFADGTLIAFGDRNDALYFTPPDRPGPWRAEMYRPIEGSSRRGYIDVDAESLFIDPVRQDLFVGYEGSPYYYHFSRTLSWRETIPAPVLDRWNGNQGPEAMARLADGRVVVIGELYARWFSRRLHPALLYPGMPRPDEMPALFEVEMPEGFRPTELALLPDGRLLVLGRKLTLAGFRTTISIADPAAIRPGGVLPTRELARITDPRLRENYEGMTVTRDADGAVAVWLIADSNLMVWAQRTLLLKLRLRPGQRLSDL